MMLAGTYIRLKCVQLAQCQGVPQAQRIYLHHEVDTTLLHTLDATDACAAPKHIDYPNTPSPKHMPPLVLGCHIQTDGSESLLISGCRRSFRGQRRGHALVDKQIATAPPEPILKSEF